MSKSNIIFGTIIGLILLMSILGMTSADSCDDKSFIRKLIKRIKASDLGDEDKTALFQRIRTYLSDGSSGFDQFVSDIVSRIANSDLDDSEKSRLYKRIRNALNC